jgi:hypothetical protein
MDGFVNPETALCLNFYRRSRKNLCVVRQHNAQCLSVDRSEQFTLSLLIHYPQYLLWALWPRFGAHCGEFTVCSWLCLANIFAAN